VPKIFRASIPQDIFLRLEERFIAFIGGIGSGKSAAGAIKAVQKINDGEPGIIVAPDFPQLSKSTFPEFLQWAPMSRCVNSNLNHPHTQQKVLRFNVRGKIVPVYYGGIEDPHSWRGPNVNWIWFDEGGRKRTRAAFDVLIGRIRIGINPQMWITTTPSGTMHWLYDVFEKQDFDPSILRELRKLGYHKKIAAYVTASTDDNKDNLDPYTYTILKAMYGDDEYRKQELEGEFVQREGAVWPSFSERNNFTDDAEYVPGVPVEWWVDDGFTKGHPRVILMAQVIPPYVNVFREYVVINEHAETSIKNALALSPVPPSVAYVDSSAAELRSRLWKEDIDTVAATHSVNEGVKRTASWICDGDGVAHVRFHPRCEKCLREISGYVIDERTQRPRKESDNAADALRYGLWFKDRETIFAEEEYVSPHHLVEQPTNVLTSAVMGQARSAIMDSGDPVMGLYRLQEMFMRMNTQERARFAELMETVSTGQLHPETLRQNFYALMHPVR